MKKFLAIVVLSMASMSSFAEATFEQIETLIQQKNYQAAEAGLEVIIQNHPKSAKAFYAMAQAQAGLGNLEKANKALNLATGLNPTLDFAPSDSVQKLKQAITPQTAKIEAVEESHALRNFVYFALFAGFGVACYFLYSVYARKRDEEEALAQAERDAEYARAEAKVKRMQEEREAEEAKAAALKAHKNYGKAGFDPANPDKLKTKKQLKDEADQAAEKQRLFFEAEAKREAQARADASIARSGPAVQQPMYTPQPSHTTVVNNSSNDLLTTMVVMDMMNHNHDITRVVEREVIREVPTPSRSSSWDDTPSTSSSRSSSWDDDSSSRSSSRSSSWSDSSSSSSSSWSSDSSDSSSSWSDSSSSSSSSDW